MKNSIFFLILDEILIFKKIFGAGKDRILNIFLTIGVISSVEEFRSDLKAKINIGAYPGGRLIYRYPLKTGKKTFFFIKNHGRLGHGVILWYSPQLIIDTARSQKSVVYLPHPLILDFL